MTLECCSQERTYLRYYGLLASRFCFLNQAYQVAFDDMFAKQYRRAPPPVAALSPPPPRGPPSARSLSARG